MRMLLAAVISVCSLAVSGENRADAWQSLRDGQAVLLMRHTYAPGIGDPDDFELGDCSTQRNLSEEGRKQARDWGARLTDLGVHPVALYSSRWCRTLETAREMRLGEVTPFPALDSFFTQRSREPQQTLALRQFLNNLNADTPVVLITHQVNITALTGVVPRSGEALILALPLSDPPEVLQRIPPP